MARLRDAYLRAAAGSGRVVLLIGEPGIGKTRATQELEGYAVERGSAVLWGRTYETPGAPPYWPWVQIANEILAARPGVELSLSTDDRAELGRIVPGLSSPNVPGSASGGTAVFARFQLFDAFLALLRATCPTSDEDQALVVVLDDLHWADTPSLLLLQHIARELAGMRLLIVGTFRDTDVARQSALAETLAEIRREGASERILLRGLSQDEVGDYVRARTSVEPVEELLDQIFETTEGNPFFVEEIVTLMAEDEALGERHAVAHDIPDGIKAALGRRLNRLSSQTNDILRTAALLGRDFGFRDVETVSGASEESLLECVEQAIGAGFLLELAEPGTYRFSHGLMRETLVAELSTTRRVMLHGQFAEALESRRGGTDQVPPAQLAHHFGEAATLSLRFASRAREYALLAARQAEQQYAWTEAWHWYEAAAAGEDNPDGAILAALARCCALADGVQRSAASAALIRAVDAFRAEGRWAELAWTVARMPTFAGFWPGMPALVDEAIEHAPAGNGELALLLRVKRLWEAFWLDSPAQEFALHEEALLECAVLESLPETSLVRNFVSYFRAERAGERNAATALALQAAMQYEQLGLIDDAGFFINNCVGLTLLGGAVTLATDLRQRAVEFNTKYRYTTGRTMEDLYGGPLAVLRWNSELLRKGRITRYIQFTPTSPLDEVRSNIPGGLAFPGLGQIPKHQLSRHALQTARTYRADVNAALADLSAWAELWCRGVARLDPQTRVSGFTIVSPCLVALGDDALCRVVYEEVRHWRNWCGPFTGIGVDACRGALALRLGLADDAQQAFRDGLEWAEREECPVEAGLNLEGLGEVALDRGDRSAAREYFGQAAAVFEKHGASLYLDAVTRRNAALGRTRTSALPGGLSAREVEVLSLLAEGRSNNDIAGSLVLSHHTVGRHVSNIFDKIHAANRAEATRWAIRQGLVE